MLEEIPEAFIFMKVGNHANETFEQILERKNREYQQAGCVFWGYGGTSCHPLQQVQPFVRMHLRQSGSIYLVMQSVNSRADPDIVPASEYSEDGINWKPIPEGVQVTGSRYAMVLDEILPGGLVLPAHEFAVGIGPSRGKSAEDYLRGHADKACLVRSPEIAVRAQSADVRERKPSEKKTRAADYVARLKEPYAVLLR